MKKYLEVMIGGPDGDIWSVATEKVVEDRVKHYAEKSELAAGSDQYKRLQEVSSRKQEVEDWARRIMAPATLRNSWYVAQIVEHDDEKRHQYAMTRHAECERERKVREAAKEPANAN